MIDALASEKDPRKCKWRLSQAGMDKHNEVIVSALEHERVMVEGLEPDDLEVFLKVLRKCSRTLTLSVNNRDMRSAAIVTDHRVFA